MVLNNQLHIQSNRYSSADSTLISLTISEIGVFVLWNDRTEHLGINGYVGETVFAYEDSFAVEDLID